MHKKNLLSKIVAFATVLLFVGLASASSINVSLNKALTTEDTEYWALIFAVGIYYKNPGQNRLSMLEAADDLYDVILDTPHWQTDHIHKVTGSQATGRRLIQELFWLLRNEDKDDMSLIYLTTHGSPLKSSGGRLLDLPPRDENDWADEILIMYEGFYKWYEIIWDDLLNLFLSLLQSKGVCLIVDSCFSGGFNDVPMFSKSKNHKYTSEEFSQGLAEDLSTQGRVVLMSSEEDEVSYGSHFTNYLIDGFYGAADYYGNKDGKNSAEEAFNYAKRFVTRQHPTILDLYSGEFIVTYT
jgi:hypothetical protein